MVGTGKGGVCVCIHLILCQQSSVSTVCECVCLRSFVRSCVCVRACACVRARGGLQEAKCLSICKFSCLCAGVCVRMHTS